MYKRHRCGSKSPEFEAFCISGGLEWALYSRNRVITGCVIAGIQCICCCIIVVVLIITLFRYDFYLVSQHVNQGTVTPTHFYVVKDETAWPPDSMQKLAYKMTHLYYNWPGTIRVPAPCQVSTSKL